MSDELLPCRETVAHALRAWDDHWSNNDGTTQEMREMAMFKAIEAAWQSRAPQPLSEDAKKARVDLVKCAKAIRSTEISQYVHISKVMVKAILDEAIKQGAQITYDK